MIDGLPSDGELARAYRVCKGIAAAHGRTYFLATRLLAPQRRPAVHALYAFARVVDDIVDRSDETDADSGRDLAGELDLIERQLRAELGSAAQAGSQDSGSRRQDPSESGHSLVPASAPTGNRRHALVLAAVADTIRAYGIAPRHFWTFLDSMRMDVPGTPGFRNSYADMAELREYMRGSAAAIGLQMLPVLGTVVPVQEAEPAAAALGEAFQLTNFLRDVGEDLDRGRIYLPADSLAAFGVDAGLLHACGRTGRTDPRVRRALAHFIAVNRDLYRHAEPGIDLLEPRVRPAIRTAAALYGDILDRIEDSGYAVFEQRAVVPRRHRLRVAATEFSTAALRNRLPR